MQYFGRNVDGSAISQYSEYTYQELYWQHLAGDIDLNLIRMTTEIEIESTRFESTEPEQTGFESKTTNQPQSQSPQMESNASSSPNVNIPLIVGIAAAALFAMIVLGATIIVLKKRSNNNKNTTKSIPMEDPIYGQTSFANL